MWSDSSANVLYSFGGDTSWDPPVNKTSFQNRFQKFIPDGSGGGEWSPDLDRTDDDVPDHISPPVGGFISQAKESGFYLGGYEPYAAVMDARYRRPAGAVPQPGIVTFNFENRIWTNDTITPYTLGGGSVGYGAMHYVPIFGPAGLLIIFGGESEDHGVPSKQLMNNITIYEHEGKTWHYQIATGSVIPKYRQYMCTVGVREDGQQSYEMYTPQANCRSTSPSEFGSLADAHALASCTAVFRAISGLVKLTTTTYGSCRSQPSSGSRPMESVRVPALVTLVMTWAAGT